MKHEPSFTLEVIDDGLGLLAMRTRVFGGVEKVRALGANGVVKGSTIGAVWFEVSGGMVSAKVVLMVVLGLSYECLGEFSLEDRYKGDKEEMFAGIELLTGSFPTPWFRGGESDEVEVEGVRVGRHGLLPLDLSWKTLLLERGIMTWSTSRKSLDKRRHESKLDLRKVEDRGWGEDHNSESGFDIVDDESNGESSIEVSNKADAFVKS
ncbi:hypothetical protein Tco_1090985 [Tanacetum coccineum]|uniref:Uncharacterized protein n=1 Tax=Tanacetum coccineum TaxID=301880 RepID=A0ABQ5I834_9ASTR